MLQGMTLHHTAPHASTTCCKHHTHGTTHSNTLAPFLAPPSTIHVPPADTTTSTTYKHHTWHHMQAPLTVPVANTTCCTIYKHHSQRHEPVSTTPNRCSLLIFLTSSVSSLSVWLSLLKILLKGDETDSDILKC